MEFFKNKQIELSSNQFSQFKQLVASVSGIKLSESSIGKLNMVIGNRSKQLNLSSVSQYYNFIRNDTKSNEIKYLIDKITINETYFFRHPSHFKILQKKIIPEIISSRNLLQTPIRIWNAGCSTGEEPYSVAIVLAEFGLISKNKVKIIATDIDNTAIEKAKHGTFLKRSFRGERAKSIFSYFTFKEGKYFLKNKIKEIPDFYTQNLTHFNSKLIPANSQDVIFCRNVFIYLKKDIIERLLDYFFRSLRKGGILFLGGTETLNFYSHKFDDVLLSDSFYYKKSLKSAILQTPMNESFNKEKFVSTRNSSDFNDNNSKFQSERLTTSLKKIKNELTSNKSEFKTKTKFIKHDTDKITLSEAQRLFQIENFEQVKVILKKLLYKTPNNVTAKILLCETYMNLGNYPETIFICKELLHEEPLNSEAYFILGSVLNKQKDKETAIQQFRRAIYLNPKLIMAHFSLANCYRDIGDFKSAIRHYINAINILKGMNNTYHIKFASGFPVTILLRTCERNIEQITKNSSSEI